ncbi:MAG TPA: ATP-binding cassette domain-containing protein, partial [bacterium]|nr:ATP-binding cassette domain-containing protein [bacterium]
EVVVRLRDLGKRYGETAVLSGVSLEVRRGEKIGVIGPNGAGKTTLLRIVAGVEPPSAGLAELGPGVRVGYFAQHAEETLDLEQTVLDAVLGDRAMSPEQVRRVLGRFLFSGETVYKCIGDLSGGEQRRVALARLVLDRPDLLLLDEPTTHFDLASLEALEQALGAFEGAILLASHDRYLLDHVARRLLIVDAGGVRGVPGPYHAYREALTAGTATAGAGPAPASGKPSSSPAASSESRPAASGQDRAREAAGGPARDRGGARRGFGRGPSADVVDVHTMLEQIASLEEEQKHLSRLMGDPELYRDAARARETVRRYEEVNTELESLYARLTAAEEGAGG